METVTLLILAVFICVCVYYLLQSKEMPRNFPPGPPGIPIFGNALQAGATAHKFGIKIEPIYGPIIGIKFGAYLAVIMNSADDIREAYNRPEFQGRYGYNPFFEENISIQTKSVVMSQGEPWQDMRQFCLKTLREFGFGKRSIETTIQEEVQELIEVKFRPNLGRPILNHKLFNASVLNVIWALVAGERFKLGDKRLDELIHIVSDTFKTALNGVKVLNLFFPLIVKFRNMLPFNLPDPNKAGREKLIGFIMKTIQDHRETFESGNPRDFIDVYFEKLYLESFVSGSIPALSRSLLFVHPPDTISATLSWALFQFASHPDIQEKLFLEIHSVAGNRAVSLDDRFSMPYTEAVMLDVHRMASLAPVGVPHSVTENAEFKGYNLPKNTMILANLFASHFSNTTWGDPFNFRPERFISSGAFAKNPNVLAFSVGKRQITFPKDEPKHTLEGQRGLVLTPIVHRIIFLDRNTS